VFPAPVLRSRGRHCSTCWSKSSSRLSMTAGSARHVAGTNRSPVVGRHEASEGVGRAPHLKLVTYRRNEVYTNDASCTLDGLSTPEPVEASAVATLSAATFSPAAPQSETQCRGTHQQRSQRRTTRDDDRCPQGLVLADFLVRARGSRVGLGARTRDCSGGS